MKESEKEGEPHTESKVPRPSHLTNPQTPKPWAQLTMVSRLLAAVPVQRPMILSMHFLWMAALHS